MRRQASSRWTLWTRISFKQSGGLLLPDVGLHEMPEKISLFVYPDRLEVRYVSGNGSVRRNRDWVNVSAVGRALGELGMPSVNRGKFAPDEIAKVETGRELRRPPGRSSSAVGNRYELAR